MSQNGGPVRPGSRFDEPEHVRPAGEARPVNAARPARGARPVGPQARPAQGEARPAQGVRPVAQAAQGARPSKGSLPGVAQAQGRLWPRLWPVAAVCVGALALGLALHGAMPEGYALSGKASKAERPVAAQVSEIHGDGPVRLNEVMSANGGVLVDASGLTGDWVEVANVSKRPVNLRGYILAKSARAGNVFVFPDRILQAGECAVVFCDSTLQSDATGELHAPFRLSSGGDVLMLFNDADVAVDTVNLPALGPNEAYVRQDRNTWAATSESTPGLLNTEENYRALTSVVANSPVQLCELVASNTQYALDESGVARDYLVLRNAGGAATDLSGWYLSDDPARPRLWRFPEGTSIPAGGTLRVYCSGESRAEDVNRLHASFKLSSEGETVTLSNANGQPVDVVTYDLLHTDEAYLRGGDGSWSVGTPVGQ